MVEESYLHVFQRKYSAEWRLGSLSLLNPDFVFRLAAILLRFLEFICTSGVKITKMLLAREVLVESVWRVDWLVGLRGITSSVFQNDSGTSWVFLQGTQCQIIYVGRNI